MILLTGCAGFIGSRVAEMLLSRGERVLGVDDMNSSCDVRLKKWRLDRLRKFKNFKFFRDDICNYRRMERIFTSCRIERVINLAARAGVRQSIDKPLIYFRTNVSGNLNLLELSRKCRVEKYILASSSSVYAGSEMPFREDRVTGEPLSPYAASKMAAELTCRAYHRLYNMDIAVLRYFTVYGPAGRTDMSPLRFIHFIHEGKPLPLYGDGTQLRDWTYIDDIAEGTIKALGIKGYEVINLGNDRPRKLSEFISIIEKLLNRRAKIKRYAFQKADMRATWADISRAEKLLGWKPGVRLEAGMERTVRWYMENRRWLKGIRF